MRKYKSEQSVKELPEVLKTQPTTIHQTISRYSFQTPSDYFLKTTTQSAKFKRLDKFRPGPGQYNVATTTLTQKGVILPKAQRTMTSESYTPGVGTYKERSHNSQSFTFRSYSERRRRQPETPGPATYTRNKGSCIGVKFTQASKSSSYIGKTSTPGPGAYSIGQMGFAPKKKKVDVMQPRKSTQSLTQSQYDTQQSFQLMKNHGQLGLQFCKGVRRFEFLDVFNVATPNPIDRSPGPAQYSVEWKLNPKKSSFSKLRRPELFVIPKGPGVGQYSKINVFGKDYTKKPRVTIQKRNMEKMLQKLINFDG